MMPSVAFAADPEQILNYIRSAACSVSSVVHFAKLPAISLRAAVFKFKPSQSVLASSAAPLEDFHAEGMHSRGVLSDLSAFGHFVAAGLSANRGSFHASTLSTH